MSHSAVLTSVRRLRSLLAAQQDRDQSDEQLLAAFAERRDEVAFATLVRRHGPMVLGVCRRVLGHVQDAEDAYQATFLVLARRATTLRDKSALGSFLHGIAYHLTSNMKRAAGRRRKYESRRAGLRQRPELGALTQPRSPADPADELLWREVREQLDEEIARLPEKYRSVFVLCCLEDLSRAEAGQRLGLKERTVLSRLAEARKRLAQSLSRRGVELPAALAAATLTTQSASALPAGLMVQTIQAAMATAAGEGLAGAVSASVSELVKGATMATMVKKTNMAAVILLAVGLLAGVGAWSYRTLMQTQPAEPQAEAFEPDLQPSQAPWPRQNKAECITVTGRVLDPDGKPKEGAKLLLLDKSDRVKQVGVSAADGRFCIAIPKAAKVPYLIAQAEGNGIDFIRLAETANPEALVDLRRTSLGVAYFPGANPEKPVELRLVKDHPIRGRIINTEGNPIAGVRVAVKILNVYADNSFQKEWKNHNFPSGIMPIGVKGLRPEAERGGATTAAGMLLATMTDADGRFTIHGVGREWGALLRFSGAGIADKEVWVVNREGIDAKAYNAEVQKSIKGPGVEMYRLMAKRLQLHDPNVPILAEPEKPIRGVVTDADNGKGRPNAVVRLIINSLEKEVRYPIAVPVQTTTDAEGRYEIRGALKAASYLLVVPSDPSTGYVACQFKVADSAGYEPLAANIRVRKGVIITGRAIDRASGRPIPGFAEARVLADNRFAKDYPGFVDAEKRETSEDGIFRVVTIPGPVLLVGGPTDFTEAKNYKPASPDPKYPQYFSKMGGKMIMAHQLGGSMGVLAAWNFCKVLEIKPGAGVVKQNIVLEHSLFWERLLR